MDRTVGAVIVAGGKGLRMKSKKRKQYLDLNGVPILVRTLRAFAGSPLVSHIVLVIPEPDLGQCRQDLLIPYALEGITVVAGGEDRQASVYNGLLTLKSLPGEKDGFLVLIHDGVRPFVDPGTIQRCVGGAARHGACIPVVPVVDTLKRAGREGFVEGTVSRDHLFKVQTPQAFDLGLIIRAHEHAAAIGFRGTDDASLVELLGIRVMTVTGHDWNLKVTTPEDLELARAIAACGS